MKVYACVHVGTLSVFDQSQSGWEETIVWTHSADFDQKLANDMYATDVRTTRLLFSESHRYGSVMSKTT
jgi:hypothetical protein